MSRTYYERPPATAKAARKAWDHFASTKGKSRGLRELFYSRHYNLDEGAHWVCILNMRDTDTMHFNFSTEDITWAISCDRLSRETPNQTDGAT